MPCQCKLQPSTATILVFSATVRGTFPAFGAWHGLSNRESMIQGLYKVSFQANGSSGDGVVFIDEGQFVGGDSCLYYFGTFQQQGEAVTVTLQTHRHSAGDEALLGQDDFTATLTGTATASGFSISSGPLVIVGTQLVTTQLGTQTPA